MQKQLYIINCQEGWMTGRRRRGRWWCPCPGWTGCWRGARCAPAPCPRPDSAPPSLCRLLCTETCSKQVKRFINNNRQKIIISNALTQSAFIAMNLVVLVGVLESNFKWVRNYKIVLITDIWARHELHNSGVWKLLKQCWIQARAWIYVLNYG